MTIEKYGWAIQKHLFAQTNQDSTFSHTRHNSEMFNITSKYFSFLTINHLQAPTPTPTYNKGCFLHVIPVRMTVPW